jgi:hypothetical protein
MRNCFIIFISLFLSQQSFACMVSTYNASITLNNPLLAPFIGIGVITINEKSQINLNLDKGWGKFKSEYRIFPLCELEGRKNFKYLFIAKLRYGDTDEPLTMGAGSLVELNNSRKEMQILAVRNDFNGVINPAWQYCESDAECVDSENQCKERVGVNKTYLKQYSDYLKLKFKSKRKLKECSAKKEIENIKSTCVDSFCS